MRLLLDTTYLIPFIGISIKDEHKDALIELRARGHKIAVSEISIFEISAKAAKYVANDEISSERVTRGIRAIIYDDSVEKIAIYETKIISTAFALKSLMVDFIDCIILSTAINNRDTLITEDNVIRKLNENKKYLEITSAINPNFKCQSYKDFMKA